MSKASLQELLDGLGPQGTLTLDPPNREFRGPVVIRRPVTILGRGATIHAPKGPVLVIENGGATLRDLTIEVTGREGSLAADAACALVVRPAAAATFENVWLSGDVVGVPKEEGAWRYPRAFRQHDLAADRPHVFKARLWLPVPCRLSCEIDGLSVQPERFSAGVAELTLGVEPLTSGVRLRGDIVIRSARFSRRITVVLNAAKPGGGKTTVSDGQWIYAFDAPSAPARKPIDDPGPREECRPPESLPPPEEYQPPVSPPPPAESQPPKTPPPPEQPPQANEEPPTAPDRRSRSRTIRTEGLAGPWSLSAGPGKPAPMPPSLPPVEASAPPPVEAKLPPPAKSPSSPRAWSPRIAGTPGGVFRPAGPCQAPCASGGSVVSQAPEAVPTPPVPDTPPSTPNSSPGAETTAIVSPSAAADAAKRKPPRKRKLVQGKDLEVFGGDSPTK